MMVMTKTDNQLNESECYLCFPKITSFSTIKLNSSQAATLPLSFFRHPPTPSSSFVSFPNYTPSRFRRICTAFIEILISQFLIGKRNLPTNILLVKGGWGLAVSPVKD